MPDFPESGDVLAYAELSARAREDLVVALRQVAERHVPVVMYRPDDLATTFAWFREASVEAGGVVGLAGTRAELVDVVSRNVGTVAANSTVKLLVIGDSTSLTFAAALDKGADGKVQVLWAGKGGCPFVRVDAIRTAVAIGWHSVDCPDFTKVLPPVLESFRPDAVVLVVGTMELAEQRYPGDPVGHLPGSAAYVAYHDSELQTLLGLLGPDGPPVIVADAPPVTAGAFSSREVAEPARLAALNAQFTRWAAQHSEVHVLEYADSIIAYERLHGVIRADGSHPEVEPLTEIMRATLVPRLLALLPARAG